MPINKLKKHQDEIPYDMVSREVVQSITNPLALAIWVYLQSQSENWNIVEAHIKQHFNIGRHSYQKAMKELKELGLYSVTAIKTKDNKFKGSLFHIHHFPQVRFPVGSVLRPTENQTSFKEEEIIKEKESNKEKDIKEITKEKFKQFHNTYLGTKRNLNTELENFTKKYKDRDEIVDLLVDRTFYGDVADPKMIPMMSTFINQRRWEGFIAKPEREWWETRQGIIDKGAEIGLKELDFKSFQPFRLAVIEKAKRME